MKLSEIRGTARDPDGTLSTVANRARDIFHFPNSSVMLYHIDNAGKRSNQHGYTFEFVFEPLKDHVKRDLTDDLDYQVFLKIAPKELKRLLDNWYGGDHSLDDVDAGWGGNDQFVNFSFIRS